MPHSTITTTLGGETGVLYRSFPWETTALGAYATWPEHLKYLINSMLCCPIPMYICWGPERVFLYNDAYRFLLAKKHPSGLGQAFESVWPEIWPTLEPLFESIKAGKNYYIEDMLMVLERNGYTEEGYFTFSFNPILDGQEVPMGLQCICYETTHKILSAQAVKKLQDESELARANAERATDQLKRFVEQAPVAIAQLEGPDHRFAFVNKLYLKIVGQRDISGHTVREVFPDLIGQPFFDLLDNVYRTGKDYVAIEAPIVMDHESGGISNAFLDFTYAARFNASGEVEGITATVVEVTAKVLARHAIEESEQQLNQLANSMPQIVWASNGAGEVDYYNKRWSEYTGQSRASDTISNWGGLLHPDDKPIVEQEWAKALETFQPLLTEGRLRNGATGEYKWFRIHAVPLKTVEGEIKKWYGSFNDIHDLRSLADQLTKTQVQLSEEKKKFEIIFENAASAMAMVREPKHIFEKANPSFQAMFGGRIVIGKDFETVFPELKGKSFIEMLDKVYKSGISYKSAEEKVTLKTPGSGARDRRFLDISFIQLKSSSGDVEGVLIDLIDVTDKVIARRRLEENREQLHLATKAAKIGIWDLNAKEDLLIFSERAAEIYGLPAGVPLSIEVPLAKIHPDDVVGVKAALQLARDPSGNGAYESVHRLVRDDGAIRSVSVFGQLRGGPKHSKTFDRLTGAIIDITEGVEIQDQLILAREAADDANSAKSAFLANMSHEIRSPLGAIMGFVELLKDEQITPAEIADYLGVIERNSHQLLRIIDDILDLSKVEAGKMLVEHIDFSLLEVLADFASLMGFKARDNGIDFVLRAETALPDPVNSDPTRVRQILTNIVGNAIKFTKKGVVEMVVSYRAPMLRFKIKDSGVGIASTEVSRLFQAFGQADVSTTRKFGGTGLGLVLTKRLSQALGGDFWLDSTEVGIGSTFIAEIAVETSAESRLIQGSLFRFTTQPVRISLQDNTLLSGKRILVVEDSPDNQMLLRVLLNRHGAMVEIAEDGLIGVEKAMAGGFDLVLMDVQMPRMDGYEAVRLLREKQFAKPVVALTAHAMLEEREKCLDAGYSDFLSKPIDRVKLLDVLKTQLRIPEK